MHVHDLQLVAIPRREIDDLCCARRGGLAQAVIVSQPQRTDPLAGGFAADAAYRLSPAGDPRKQGGICGDGSAAMEA